MRLPFPGRGVRTFLVLVGLAVLVLAALVGPRAAFHLLPLSMTGEDARLAAIAGIGPGAVVAEIGAGRGAFSAALARRIRPGGRIYSTELSAERLAQIRARAVAGGLTNLTVVEAGEFETRLPDACCDAVLLRTVYHHIGDRPRFNESLFRAVRPGGRVAVIDFRPGEFLHLRSAPAGAGRNGSGHGVTPERVREELEGAGFQFQHRDDTWGGGLFLVVMRKPGVTATRPQA